MDYLTICLIVLSDSEESEQANERYHPSIHINMIYVPNLFNASHKISINRRANLDAKNEYLRIQCMKCGGYGHIQAECANTWSDDESKACNEGDDICNELVAPINLSEVEQCLSNPNILHLIHQSIHQPISHHASMTTLSPLDVATTDAISGDDEEISNEKMVHSYKVMYEKLVEIVNENRVLLKKISQLSRENNELIKQVNSLKSGMEDTQNELEQVKKIVRMPNYGTTSLDQILMMRRTTKGHEGLRFKGESS